MLIILNSYIDPLLASRATWQTSDWSNITPSYGGSGYTYVGFFGNGPSLSQGDTFTLFIPRNINGIRIILQAAGGASSNNDHDADSSGNSGATVVFDIPANMGGNTATILIGSAGPNYDLFGGRQQNVNSRNITLAVNPFNSPIVVGQAGYSGNAAYNSCFNLNGTLYGYAEGGGATLNFDTGNSRQSSSWVNTTVSTLILSSPGPIHMGRGYAPNNSNFPNWNFKTYPALANAYGLSPTYIGNVGQGGWEAPINGKGYSGQSGFMWAIIL